MNTLPLTRDEKVAIRVSDERHKISKLQLKNLVLTRSTLVQRVKILELEKFMNDALIHKLRAQRDYLYTAQECRLRLELATKEREGKL